MTNVFHPKFSNFFKYFSCLKDNSPVPLGDLNSIANPFQFPEGLKINKSGFPPM